MEPITEVKDYEMDHEYAVENFLGLSLEEQVLLLHNVEQYALKSEYKWKKNDFNLALKQYYETIKDIVISARRFSRLRSDHKKIYSINLVRSFYEDFKYDLEDLNEKENLDDNLEYYIICKFYFDKINNNKQLSNPDRIYLQDLAFKNDEEKNHFYSRLIMEYYPNRLEYMPMTKRIIELYEPILLEIYGEELYNFIKSFHHSFAYDVVRQIASFHKPYGKNFISNEIHECFQDMKYDSLDEELEYERKVALEKIQESFGFSKKVNK